MLKILENLLLKGVSDLRAGNSNISEEEAFQIIQSIKIEEMSKTKAMEYLDMCRTTFDNYVRDGLLPKGREVYGFKEKRWYKSELDAFKLKYGNKQK